VVGLTASFSQVGHAHDYVRILNGLTGTVSIAGGAGVTVSTASSSITISAGGGGAANIVEATTAAGFPATGASQTLYISRDQSRVFRFDASGVYVELGPPVGSSGPPLSAPTAFTAAAGNAQVLLRWTAPAGIITDYRVESSTDSGSTWTIFSQAITSENIEGAFVVLTGLTNGQTYRFRLAAVNSAGRGEYSAASSAVTPSL
jgi:hypothetical protein